MKNTSVPGILLSVHTDGFVEGVINSPPFKAATRHLSRFKWSRPANRRFDPIECILHLGADLDLLNNPPEPSVLIGQKHHQLEDRDTGDRFESPFIAKQLP